MTVHNFATALFTHIRHHDALYLHLLMLVTILVFVSLDDVSIFPMGIALGGSWFTVVWCRKQYRS